MSLLSSDWDRWKTSALKMLLSTPVNRVIAGTTSLNSRLGDNRQSCHRVDWHLRVPGSRFYLCALYNEYINKSNHFNIQQYNIIIDLHKIMSLTLFFLLNKKQLWIGNGFRVITGNSNTFLLVKMYVLIAPVKS
jgi:hypothetical protein